MQQQEQPQAEADEMEGMRFSARSVKAQRQRLGLSAADYGKLLGVSGLTIYNWEHEKSRPRKAQFAALVAARDLGKTRSPGETGRGRGNEKETAKRVKPAAEAPGFQRSPQSGQRHLPLDGCRCHLDRS